MQLRKTCINRGFSIIELVVVLGILTVLASCTLVISMKQFQSHSFADQEVIVIAALQKARSEAMSGVCNGAGCAAGLPHGIYITQNSVIIFQGNTYNSNDETNESVELSSRVITFAGLNQIVFAELTGNAQPGTITLTGTAANHAVITIGSEGQILW